MKAITGLSLGRRAGACVVVTGVTLLLVGSGRTLAQKARPLHQLETKPQPTPAVAMEPRVNRLEIDLTLDPETGNIAEHATVTISAKGLSEFSFRVQEPLVVERSRASQGVIEHRKAGENLNIVVDPPISGTRTLSFDISGHPLRDGKDLVARDRAVLGPGDGWYPVMPSTWAEATVTVHAPQGWTAVAPGARDDKAPAGAWRWRTSKPVRTLAVVASPALVPTEDVAIKTPIRVFSPQGGTRADAIHSQLSDAIAWLSGALAPYPFDGFNLVLLPGLSRRIRASGMMIVPAETPIASAPDGADLLSGQWFGEIVAGDGAWIEAFAAWEAVVFARDRAVPPPAEVARLREAYFAMSGSRDRPIATAGDDAPAEVLRGKGSAAPDMVRLVVGDQRFFDAIRDLFAAPIGPPMSLRQIQSAVEKRANRTLLRPFADWFERSGAPEFEATLRTFPASTGGIRADLTLRQKRGIYALPVEVILRSADEEHREVVDVDEEVTSTYYVLSFEPVRVEVDPLDRIFRWKGPTGADSR